MFVEIHKLPYYYLQIIHYFFIIIFYFFTTIYKLFEITSTFKRSCELILIILALLFSHAWVGQII